MQHHRKVSNIRIDRDVAYVSLTQGYEAVIDVADVPLVEGFKWRAGVNRLRSNGTISTVYAVGVAHIADGRRTSLMMHRLIASTPDGFETDHIDSDGLNNRRNNLRIVTKSQNMHNRRATHNSLSGVKGVYWRKRDRCWEVVITLNRVRHYQGEFKSLEAAIAKAEEARSALHSEFARAS